MYSRYIKYIIYGTPYFLAILHFHCILVWLFCNSCVRSFLPMVLMNVFYFFRICQVSWISFVLKCYYNVFGYPYAHSFITYEHLYLSIAISILCSERKRSQPLSYSKWGCHGLFKDFNRWKRSREITFETFFIKPAFYFTCNWNLEDHVWFKYLLLRCLYTPMSGLDVKDLIYRI